MPFQAAVAVHGILRDHQRLLLIRRAGTGYRDGQLSLPAGHLDGGEDAVTGLVRELREELGIEADPHDCRLALLMHSAPEFADDSEYLHLFFVVGTWSGEPRITEPDKCSELLWADERTPLSDLADYVREALAAVNRGDRLALHGWGSHPDTVE